MFDSIGSASELFFFVWWSTKCLQSLGLDYWQIRRKTAYKKSVVSFLYSSCNPLDAILQGSIVLNQTLLLNNSTFFLPVLVLLSSSDWPAFEIHWIRHFPVRPSSPQSTNIQRSSCQLLFSSSVTQQQNQHNFGNSSYLNSRDSQFESDFLMICVRFWMQFRG